MRLDAVLAPAPVLVRLYDSADVVDADPSVPPLSVATELNVCAPDQVFTAVKSIASEPDPVIGPPVRPAPLPTLVTVPVPPEVMV